MHGRNKIQDIWSPVVYKLVEVPAADGAPYMVERADGTGDSKRIQRTEIQPCPDKMVQTTKQAQTVSRCKSPTWKEDYSSTDSDEEDSQLLVSQITMSNPQVDVAQPGVEVAADVSLEQEQSCAENRPYPEEDPAKQN